MNYKEEGRSTERNLTNKDIQKTKVERAKSTAKMMMVVPDKFERKIMAMYAKSIALFVFEKMCDPTFIVEAQVFDTPLDTNKAPMKDRKAIYIPKSLADH